MGGSTTNKLRYEIHFSRRQLRDCCCCAAHCHLAETVTARFQQLDSVSFRGTQETTQQHIHVDVCSLMRLSQRMKTFFSTYFIAMFFVDGFLLPANSLMRRISWWWQHNCNITASLLVWVAQNELMVTSCQWFFSWQDSVIAIIFPGNQSFNHHLLRNYPPSIRHNVVKSLPVFFLHSSDVFYIYICIYIYIFIYIYVYIYMYLYCISNFNS